MVAESAVQVPTNWRSNIEQVVSGYETEPAKGLVHGLQKDSIQNTWGARKTNKGSGWGTRFQLIKNDLGTFLTVEDWGTTGMTGPNMPMDKINSLSGELGPDHKLARFSAMNYSGGNEGAGLYGRGKLLFSAASKDYHFYFETFTEEEGYRANYKRLNGNMLVVNPVAFEGEVAKNFIREEAGIEPINRVGSRIIIVNPRDEIINAVENGNFLKYIEETWWRILLKYSHVSISVEYNGIVEKAKIPAVYADAIEEKNGWKAWNKDRYSVSNYHSVKKIQLFVSEFEIDEELCGVFFYRRDMKIGKIDLDIPPKIRNKYFGFIEVDSDWEDDLAMNEDLEHYGVKRKSKKCFQKLKFEVTNEHKLFMEDLGLFKKKKSEDERLRQELTEISQGLESFFNDINVSSIGSKGPKKEKIDVSWAGMEFPNSKQDRLYTRDEIKNIKFKIKNNTGSTRKVEYKLRVICRNEEVKTIATSVKEIQGSAEEIFGPFNLVIDSPLVRFEKNFINLEVSFAGKTITKEIPIYYDITPITTPRHNFLVKNSSMTFPHQDSKRINTNESLKDIKYTIENNTIETAYIAFHLSTHNVEKSNELLESALIKKDIVLNPYDKIEIDCPDIFFSTDAYESEVGKGKIELRARISAAKDFLNYETAEELSKGSKITVYFNQDPDGIGSTFSDFRMLMDENGKRSDLINEDGNWVFEVYVKHPAYERIADDDEHRIEYLNEEMLKQMVRAHIQEGNFSILNIDEEETKTEDELEELPAGELIQKIYQTLDKLQYKRLKL